MYQQKLTDVPSHILGQPANIKAGMKWQADYNIAAWFRFKQLSHDIVKLHVHWQDDAGQHGIIVDQTTISSNSLLLSGIARIRINGTIRAMTVTLETNNLSYTVDELFVQPARQHSVAKQA